MKVADILTIMQNKVSVLTGQRAEAVTSGNLELVNSLDAQITETQQTVVELSSLVPTPGE
jgi:hypothetical protein